MRSASLVLSIMAAGMFVGHASGQIVKAAWLAGCWEARSSTAVVEEQWMAPRARTMISMGRTVHGDTLVDYEQVVLREKNGKLEYEVHPYNQAIGVFLSTELSETRLVFENPLHDFPQRIGYTLLGGDSLVARLDGTVDGKSHHVEFQYARVRCGT